MSDKINVLYINSQDNDAVKSFKTLAKWSNCSINTCETIESGKKEYLNYDCVLIDSLCKLNDQCDAKFYNIRVAIDYFKDKKPFFIFVSDDNDKNSEYFDGYKDIKSSIFCINQEQSLLFKSIQEKVEKQPEVIRRRKYTEIYNFYKGSVNLDDIIRRAELNDKEFYKDDTIPNSVRTILEWCAGELEKKGFPKYTKPYITDWSKSMSSKDENGKKNYNVPEYILRNIHTLTNVCGEVSHEGDSRKLISKGEAIYLNKSLVFDLLNILHWCTTLK